MVFKVADESHSESYFPFAETPGRVGDHRGGAGRLRRTFLSDPHFFQKSFGINVWTPFHMKRFQGFPENWALL